jgi:imidazolonepropionase-like amidohydrolase
MLKAKLDSKSLILKNINIIDGKGNKFFHKNVIIEDTIIKKILDTSKNNIRMGFAELDLKDYWVMPGMIDMHVHLCAPVVETRKEIPPAYWRMTTLPGLKVIHAANNAYKSLIAGFTSLRNCGHVTYYEPEDVILRDAISLGLINGPRIIASAGSITMTAGHGDLAFSRYLHRVPELRYGDMSFNGPWGCVEGVREKIRFGADFIKIMASGGMSSGGDEPWWPNFQLEELKAMVYEAHSLGKKVAAHAQGEVSIKRVVEAGVDTVEHGCDLDEAICDMMASTGIFLVPTLKVISNSTNSQNTNEREKAKKLVEIHSKSIKIALRTGVKIAFGTDTFNDLLHGENAHELLYLKELGMSNTELIKCITYNAAEALGLSDRIGYIGEGATADLIIMNKNPLEDIKHLTIPENIIIVIKEGKIVKNSLLNY